MAHTLLISLVDTLEGAFTCLVQELSKTLDETYELVHLERVGYVDKSSGGSQTVEKPSEPT